jgi:hypothetical protein
MKKKRSVKEPPRILFPNKKKGTALLKAHYQQKIKQTQEERGNRWTTWREILRKSNRPPLTGNTRWGRRLKHSY